MKIITIIGARPQFIKAAVVSRAIRDHNARISRPESRITEMLVHTGQHYDNNMSDIFFDELDIPRPDHHLGIGGGTHGQNTGRMLEMIEGILLLQKPDRVLVYGDTDTTLAGALAAVKLHVPLAHVEAGLRSFNRKMPEEINRVLTDHVSDLLFTPTNTSTINLMREGIQGDKVRQVGDVMYDATLYYTKQAEQISTILQKLSLDSKSYILASVHRAENTEDRDRLNNILLGFAGAHCPVVWPMHPRTRKRLAIFGLQLPATVRMIDPVGYHDMMMLEKNARMIATDSGGVQKEAFFHGVRCITLRDETEWTELVEAGANTIVGADRAKISESFLSNTAMNKLAMQFYGDGEAGKRICQELI